MHDDMRVCAGVSSGEVKGERASECACIRVREVMIGKGDILVVYVGRGRACMHARLVEDECCMGPAGTGSTVHRSEL